MTRRSEKYYLAFAAIRAVVNAHDPIGLLQLGAPADEYERAVAYLVPIVLRDERIAEQTVNQVWVKCFGTDYSMSGTDELAALTGELGRLRLALQER